MRRGAIMYRPGSAHGDPSRQYRDLFRRHLAGRGHLEAIVVDRLDEQALAGLARDKSRTRFAALQDRFERVEP